MQCFTIRIKMTLLVSTRSFADSSKRMRNVYSIKVACWRQIPTMNPITEWQVKMYQCSLQFHGKSSESWYCFPSENRESSCTGGPRADPCACIQRAWRRIVFHYCPTKMATIQRRCFVHTFLIVIQTFR